MEENTVELFDYFRVIYKRKILIIVVTLICIGVAVGARVGVGVMDSRAKAKLPVTYCSDAVVKIGKKVELIPSSASASRRVTYVESPVSLVESIPFHYNLKAKEAPGYHLDVKQIGSLAMLKLTLKGPDRGVERVLEELVDMLADEHRRKAEDSVVAYKNFMRNLEVDAEMLKKDIAVIDASIKEMKRKEVEYLIHIDSTTKDERKGGDRSAFLNMLYLKTIDKENMLSKRRANLRDIQMQLIIHQITLGNLEEYKTAMVGEIRTTAIKPKEMKKSTKHEIILAGIVGLIMSLFIAFFMEYHEESKRKGK